MGIKVKYEKIINAMSISKNLVKNYVNEGDIVLDATVGNGYDTLDLARLVGCSGKVYGFDIQNIAIQNTKSLLKQNNLLDRVILINANHEDVDKYIFESLSLAIYNLGYLPAGDKEIKTRPLTTVASVMKTLKLLKNNGILIIVSYIGHPGGLEEMKVLEEELKKLNQKQFSVLKNEFINQINSPPLLYVIEKAKTP